MKSMENGENNIVLSYTYNKQNKQISFPVSYGDISINKDFSISQNKLLRDKQGVSRIHSFSNGDSGNTFGLTILTQTVDKIKELDYLYTHLTPFTIVFPPSIILKTLSTSTKWIITDLNKKQENEEFITIDLTFHTYNPSKSPSKLSNKKTTLSNKFKKQCTNTYKTKLKKKQTNDCIELMNTILCECGYNCYAVKRDKKGKVKKDNKGHAIYEKVNGKRVPSKTWGKLTTNALKKFKKDYNGYVASGNNKKKPIKKVGEKGVMTKQMFNALVDYASLKNAKKGTISSSAVKTNKKIKNAVNKIKW